MDEKLNYFDNKTLDLHGEAKEFARLLVKDFVKDHYKMGSDKIIIIHGLGEGILRKVVRETLKNNPYVEEFYLDFFNPGQTIVKMKKKN